MVKEQSGTRMDHLAGNAPRFALCSLEATSAPKSHGADENRAYQDPDERGHPAPNDGDRGPKIGPVPAIG